MQSAQWSLVLNKHWTPVGFTSVWRALCKLYEGSARAIAPEDFSTHDFDAWVARATGTEVDVVRSAHLAIPVPEVIVLVRYGKVPERRVAFSRRNLFKRDRFTCQYCQRRPGLERLTIDHVLPRSRGGRTQWTNCATACLDCNHRKADRTPSEAGLVLHCLPAEPPWTSRLASARIHRKPVWTHFVPETTLRAEGIE